MSEIMTIPLSKRDKEILKNQAAKEGRTFSGYIQKIFDNHIQEQKTLTVKPSRKKKFIVKRRKR